MEEQRTRRDEQRPATLALATSAGLLGLLLWLIATALPGERSISAPPPSDSTPTQHGSRRDAAHPPPLDALPAKTDTPSIDSSRPVDATALHDLVSWYQPRTISGDVPASFATHVPTPEMTRLPRESAKLESDGFPASAMRCTFDSGVMTCGSCRTDGDCPAGQGCVANRETRRFECMSSDCEEDANCFPGLVCRAVTNGASGIAIRRCTPEGVRREGEMCDLGYVSPDTACQEGLRCISMVCAVACRLDDPSSCPSSYLCKEGRDGPGCVPDCRQLGCLQGQQCKRIGGTTYQCLRSVVGTCPETPCAENERCVSNLLQGRGSFWCARSCNPLFPDSCPSDHVCGRASPTTSACFRGCDPRDLDSCGKGWTCTTVSEDMTLWGCKQDYPE
jgi:hypothetical protein